MLSEIRVRNFALIDRLTVPLSPGLNVLTGETGAGKSILLGALSLLLGERASGDMVRAGADRASVEGIFEVEGRPGVLEWIDEHGIEAAGDLVILKREIAAEGRGRAWINGSPVSLGLLGELGSSLLTIHGQHQHQALLRKDEQRRILDAYGELEPLARQVADTHRTVSSLSEQLRTLEERRRVALQRADFLRFQVTEIEEATIEEGEEEKLESESRRLSHAEELLELTASLTRAITGSDSATGRLGSVRRGFDRLIAIDPSCQELAELFDTAWYALEEIGSRLDDYSAGIEHDPSRLEMIRVRRDLLYRLRTKYGPELPDVLETLRAAREELSLVDDADREISGLSRRLEVATTELGELASRLSEGRCTAATAVEVEINRILPDLGMSGGSFRAVVTPRESISRQGADDIEFMVSLNAGFDPRPLSQVASGGELSRVMLALETILARVDAVPTLVFDEVDSGVGGRVALQVGDKLRQVAGNHQVLAITHLPQIAARAHHHLLVQKSDEGEVTSTSVVPLDENARVSEVARMLGGDPDSSTSVAHARELLQRGRENRMMPLLTE
ncbi:MAG: DNA repair protein RecN [Gemmatimonadota bacterium]|jgi:DNA repair protein RecN (Recombination protein N)|nr:DNA repair protein RecN [Gemmatimonadota bacterium]